MKLTVFLKLLQVNRVLGQMDSSSWHSYNYATEMHATYKRDRTITAEFIPIVILFSFEVSPRPDSRDARIDID